MSDASLVVETVLVPVDGSDESTAAVEYAVAIADAYGASVHAKFVLGEEAARAIDAGAIDADAVADDTRAAFEVYEAVAAERDVTLTHSVAAGFSAERLLVHPGSVILDTADQIDADFIVIPRESIHGDPAEVLDKAAEYVLLYASQPVLSV